MCLYEENKSLLPERDNLELLVDHLVSQSLLLYKESIRQKTHRSQNEWIINIVL